MQPAATSNEGSRASPKLAYLILAHSDPVHFERLLRRLADPQVQFVVHVDAKARQDDFERAAAHTCNVVFVSSRVHVMWAGFSMVEAMLRLIETSLTVTDRAYSHFILLSGADYPIAPNEAIIQTLLNRPQHQYLRRFDILACGDARQIRRVRGHHFREWADRHTFWRKPLFVFERSLDLWPRRMPDGLKITSGSQWWAITRDFAAFCADFARANPAFCALFRRMFAPDEIFFHTLLDNSPFVDQAEPIEPYLDVTELGGPWRYGNLHYLNAIEPVRGADEAEQILSRHPDKLFARKFHSAVSGAALDTIDRWLDRKLDVGRPQFDPQRGTDIRAGKSHG
jgi:hypothetical protein